MPFNFSLVHTAWNATAIANLIGEYEKLLPPGGWPNWVLGNHDQPRIAARVGGAQARVAAMLLLTLRGTPTMYYGDELGLARVDVSPNLAQDPWERNEPGLGVSRDPWRTPFQWDGSTHAGFTGGRPWLPLDPDWRERNVQSLREQRRSLLWLYRHLIELRTQHRALSIGDARVIGSIDNVLTYERIYEGEKLVVALNLGPNDRVLSAKGLVGSTVLLSTHLDRDGPVFEPVLRGNEGIVFRPTS